MSRMVDIDYSKYETLGEIKGKYSDSTLVMRKQFIDMAIQHEWNHGRPVGQLIGACIELDPRCNAGVVANAMTQRIIQKLVPELQRLIESTAEELGKLHVRVTFYKEPRF